MTNDEQEVLDVLSDKIYVLVAWELAMCEPEWVKDMEPKYRELDVFKISWISKKMTAEEAKTQQKIINASSKRQIDIMKWKDIPDTWKNKYDNVQNL